MSVFCTNQNHYHLPDKLKVLPYNTHLASIYVDKLYLISI